MDDKEKIIHSADEFFKLRRSRNPEDYEKASHYSADENVWRDIIKRYPHMKKWVVHNKTVPMSILTLLISDDDVEVRYFIAQKNKISKEMFEILSNDKDESVRNRLIDNKNVPIDILQKLANDEIDWVRQNALEKLERKIK